MRDKFTFGERDFIFSVLHERYGKGVRAINDQLVVVKMYAASSTINIIQEYAPSAASEEKLVNFTVF